MIDDRIDNQFHGIKNVTHKKVSITLYHCCTFLQIIHISERRKLEDHFYLCIVGNKKLIEIGSLILIAVGNKKSISDFQAHHLIAICKPDVSVVHYF